jgi:hypothetical protein
MKKVLKGLGYALLFLVLLNILGTIFPSFANLFTKKDEINIRTGQIRFTTYLLGKKISENVIDTFISKTLQKEIQAADIKPWHTVNSISYISSNPSPHYLFHGAIFQLMEVKELLESNSFSESKKKEIAERLLTKWQTSGNYFKANDYIFQLKDEIKSL